MSAPAFVLDSPWPGSQTLTGHNFREVAPEILSPLSWSIIGAGMEQGMRQVAQRLGVATSDAPAFVAYVGFRPFHVVDGMERLLTRIPGAEVDDLWHLVFGGRRPAMPRPGSAVLQRVVATPRVVRILTGTADEFGATHALVAEAEALARRPSADPHAVLGAAVAAGRRAWALHMRTTCQAVVTGTVLRAALAHDFDDASARALVSLYASREVEAASSSLDLAAAGAAGGERARLYEVADRSDRFRAEPVAPPTTRRRGAVTTVDDVLGTSPARRRLHLGLIRLFRIALAEREESKALALRPLDVVRSLLDADAFGVDAGDAALLAAHELEACAPDRRARVVGERAEDLERARATAVPVEMERTAGGWRELARPAATFDGTEARGRGLAGGRAVGVLTASGASDDGVLFGRTIEAADVLRSLPVAAVSELGSAISHVAIVCRELGIPLAAGIVVPPSMDGVPVEVDGWAGTVRGATLG